MSNWLTRTFHGFRQTREYNADTGKPIGPWKFQIAGFDFLGNPNKCSVLLPNGIKMPCTIDNQDRLIIDGKKYGRKFWNH